MGHSWATHLPASKVVLGGTLGGQRLGDVADWSHLLIYETAPADVYWSPLRKELQALAPPVVDGAVAWPEAPGIGFELPVDLEKHFVKSGAGWRYHEPQE